MTPTEFDAWCAAKARQHGDRWDPSDLAAEFVPFFETTRTPYRLRVQYGDGPDAYIRTGTVNVTTGWRPAFLLMHRSSDQGSGDVLGPHDHITHFWTGREYAPIANIRTRPARRDLRVRPRHEGAHPMTPDPALDAAMARIAALTPDRPRYDLDGATLQIELDQPDGTALWLVYDFGWDPDSIGDEAFETWWVDDHGVRMCPQPDEITGHRRILGLPPLDPATEADYDAAVEAAWAAAEAWEEAVRDDVLCVAAWAWEEFTATIESLNTRSGGPGEAPPPSQPAQPGATTTVEIFTATFTPQAWINNYAVEVDAQGPTSWDATAQIERLGDRARRVFAPPFDADPDGDPVPDDNDLLFDRDAAEIPEWIRQWNGPFDIHVTRNVAPTVEWSDSTDDGLPCALCVHAVEDDALTRQRAACIAHLDLLAVDGKRPSVDLEDDRIMVRVHDPAIRFVASDFDNCAGSADGPYIAPENDDGSWPLLHEYLAPLVGDDDALAVSDLLDAVLDELHGFAYMAAARSIQSLNF